MKLPTTAQIGKTSQSEVSSNLRIKVVTDTREFESLRDTWDELLARSGDNNLFLTWEWLFTWWKYYGDGHKLNILLIEDGDRIIGVLPLMNSSYRKCLIGFDVLENLSITDTDKSGIILTERKEEALATLLAYLEVAMKKMGVILRMKQIPEDSEFIKLLHQQIPSFSSSVAFEERMLTGCPYLPLPATWDEFRYSMSRKRRGNLRRALESLERNHKVEFRSTITGNDLALRMGELVALHQKRWQEQGFSGVFADQKTVAFYTEVANLFAERGWLDLSFMNVNGQAVSAVYGARYAQKFYYILTAFDREYAEHSVGNLHIMHLIEYAIKNGINEFDFLMGVEPYKVYWTPLVRNNMQVVLMRRRFASNVWLRLFHVAMRLNSVFKRSLLENLRLYVRKRQWQKVGQRLRKGTNVEA